MRAEQYKQCLWSLRHFLFFRRRKLFEEIKNLQSIFQRLFVGAESFSRHSASVPKVPLKHLRKQSVYSDVKVHPNLSASKPRPFRNRHTTAALSETNVRLVSRCSFGRTLSFLRELWKRESPKPCHHRKHEKSRFANAGISFRLGRHQQCHGKSFPFLVGTE